MLGSLPETVRHRTQGAGHPTQSRNQTPGGAKRRTTGARSQSTLPQLDGEAPDPDPQDDPGPGGPEDPSLEDEYNSAKY